MLTRRKFLQTTVIVGASAAFPFKEISMDDLTCNVDLSSGADQTAVVIYESTPAGDLEPRRAYWLVRGCEPQSPQTIQISFNVN